MPDDVKSFVIEDARLIFRNFRGKEQAPYNREGDRNFAVILDPEIAEVMAKDGWLVKYLNAREEGESDIPYIQVAVSYKYRPPKIVMITDSARTNITEETVGTLDWADIKTCDLMAQAYEWEVGGKSGIKAYLQTMFVTVNENYLERKYAIDETE